MFVVAPASYLSSLYNCVNGAKGDAIAASKAVLLLDIRGYLSKVDTVLRTRFSTCLATDAGACYFISFFWRFLLSNGERYAFDWLLRKVEILANPLVKAKGDKGGA